METARDFKEGGALKFILILFASSLAILLGSGGSRAETCGPAPECYLVDDQGNEQWGTSIIMAQEEFQGVYALADAIQACEGWGRPNSLARRNNNPGNLKAGGNRDSQGHTIYGSSLEGRMALERLVWRHSGETVSEMSKWYASASKVWEACVASKIKSK